MILITKLITCLTIASFKLIWITMFQFDHFPTVINSHREPPLPNAPGGDKLWEETSPETERSENSGTKGSHRCGEAGGAKT